MGAKESPEAADARARPQLCSSPRHLCLLEALGMRLKAAVMLAISCHKSLP
jgi:hypothetical protein